MISRLQPWRSCKLEKFRKRPSVGGKITNHVLTLTLILVLPRRSRQSHVRRFPAVPNFPDLTREQEDAFDKVIDDFIRAESSPRKDTAARDALDRLPPEAIYALIRGLNRTPPLESTKPAYGLAKKIAVILVASKTGLLSGMKRGGKEPRKQQFREDEAKFDKIVDDFIEYDLVASAPEEKAVGLASCHRASRAIRG